MTSPYSGFTINRTVNEAMPASTAQMSVLGLCGPFAKATAADQNAFDTAFPLNTPVLINSTDANARLIDPDSVIGMSLSLINAQMATYQSAAQVILVRTATGVNDDATIANIVGDAASRTGIHAFRRAGALCGRFPRLIACPGWTRQVKTGVTGIVIGSGGSGYSTAPTVAFSGGGGTGATATATISGGIVTAITITNPGAGYTSAPTVSFSGGGGSGAAATASVGMLANPVTAELPAVLNSILAIAYVYDGGTSQTNSLAYRDTVNSDRIVIASIGVKRINSAGSTVTIDPSAGICAMHAALDFPQGGLPIDSVHNKQVRGIIGVGRDIEFSTVDGSTEGQVLIADQLGIVVRGEVGDDFAAETGFTWWGLDNTGSNTIWRQTHKVRIRDFVELTAIRSMRAYIGNRITTQTIQALINTIEDVLEKLVQAGAVYGYRVRFDEANNVNDLRTGLLYIDLAFEEIPVVRTVAIESTPYARALETTIQNLLASQNLVN